MCSEKYVEDCELKLKGKLGCNMSHLLILKNFINENKYDWLLVLEDDISINKYNDNIIKLLIEKVQTYNSNFIKLYVNPKLIHKQILTDRKEANIYQMINQLDANAYLINKAGAEYIISKTPIDIDIDLFYSTNIKELNALTFINNIFINLGTLEDFGSLILDIKSKL